MTEQTNAERIAEARQRRTDHPTQTSDGPLIDRLADALEAAEQRAEQAEAEVEGMLSDSTRWMNRALPAEQRAAELAAALEAAETQKCNALCRDVEQERDQLAAVVEKVRRIVPHPNRLDEYGVEPLRWAVRRTHETLATAPADALREHDEALIEKLADKAQHQNRMLHPWLREEARQRREERA
ncbi:MAG: hypothetical protein ACTH4Y_08230 [Microbacterium gubbeenense]|uniref:hypothetical protein n=1 Tax=Microbacterium gubbeenense TaxID=159896 RepID=UPI003F954F06